MVDDPSNPKKLNKRGLCVDNDDDDTQWSALACRNFGKAECYERSFKCTWKRGKCTGRVHLYPN